MYVGPSAHSEHRGLRKIPAPAMPPCLRSYYLLPLFPTPRNRIEPFYNPTTPGMCWVQSPRVQGIMVFVAVFFKAPGPIVCFLMFLLPCLSWSIGSQCFARSIGTHCAPRLNSSRCLPQRFHAHSLSARQPAADPSINDILPAVTALSSPHNDDVNAPGVWHVPHACVAYRCLPSSWGTCRCRGRTAGGLSSGGGSARSGGPSCSCCSGTRSAARP